MRTVRCLLISQSYPPDVGPTSVYVHDVARGLVAAGHQVAVLAQRGPEGAGGGREQRDGVEVRRLGGSFLGGLGGTAVDYSFVATALPGLMTGRKPDVVVSLPSPPYAGLMGAFLAHRRRARHVHWAIDTLPDVLPYTAWGWLVRSRLEALWRWQMARTHLVIAPTSAMARLVTERSGTRAEAVPLWSHELATTPADVPALRDRLDWPRSQLVLLHADEMGPASRLDEFLEAARTLGPNGPAWFFTGSGSRVGEVSAAAAPGLTIRLLPPVAPEAHRDRLLAADVHLVSLRSTSDGRAVPASLPIAFGLGRPVFFVGSRDAEPARWVEESGGGWVIGEGDLPGLIRAVAEATARTETRRRGAAALAYARDRFSTDRGVAQMIRLIERG
jgi:glycosyltransferase involved in cell wall biosynthesis